MFYINCLKNSSSFEESLKILEEKQLKVKQYENPSVYIVTYNKKTCDMNDPDIKKCRGLILSREDNSVVCPVPPKSESNIEFIKYFNSSPEKYSVQEFLDGTMINVFNFHGETYISTRSCLGAKCKWMSNSTFAHMFEECLEATNNTLSSLDMDYCYSFLIQHPDNTIVKKYMKPSLVLTHVSKINKEDGTFKFLNVPNFVKDKGYTINVPIEYTFNSIEDVYKKISEMDESEQGIIINNKNIGSSYKRCKIRNIRYNVVRQLKGNTNNKHFLFFMLRKAGNGSYDNYISFFEEDRELFENYRQELYTFTQTLFQTYLECFVLKNDDGSSMKNHKDIDFELKPLVGELHGKYLENRKPTTKNSVIQYLYNLPIPRLLFSINYKKKC